MKNNLIIRNNLKMIVKKKNFKDLTKKLTKDFLLIISFFNENTIIFQIIKKLKLKIII